MKKTLRQYIDQFGIVEMLNFFENGDGGIHAAVNTTAAFGEVYMQGAHLARWWPRHVYDHEVLYLSTKSDFREGKAIRGGVPLIFPWFGARHNDKEAPAHGFVRTSNDWILVEAGRSFEDFVLKFELSENEKSQSFGYSAFKLTYKISIGKELELELKVENTSHEILQFEEAFHTYFSVSDIQNISINGLEGTEYLDKTDGFIRKSQTERTLTFSGETDRPYLNTKAAIEIVDNEWQRKIIVDKLGSSSTVIWNPWKDLPDMYSDEWKQMVCVETANLNENYITLPPGSHHTMHAVIKVEPN